MTKGKKAIFELSTTTVVIIILVMTMLILGLGIVPKIIRPKFIAKMNECRNESNLYSEYMRAGCETGCLRMWTIAYNFTGVKNLSDLEKQGLIDKFYECERECKKIEIFEEVCKERSVSEIWVECDWSYTNHEEYLNLNCVKNKENVIMNKLGIPVSDLTTEILDENCECLEEYYTRTTVCNFKEGEEWEYEYIDEKTYNDYELRDYRNGLEILGKGFGSKGYHFIYGCFGCSKWSCGDVFVEKSS